MANISIRADLAKQYGNTITDVIYSDLPTNLDVHPFSGDLSKLINNGAINASIRHIVLTIVGERPYSQVGSTINYSLFQLQSIVQSELMQQSILSAISLYEPRVNVIKIDVTAIPANESILVNVQYNIINIKKTFSTQIILERNL